MRSDPGRRREHRTRRGPSDLHTLPHGEPGPPAPAQCPRVSGLPCRSALKCCPAAAPFFGHVRKRLLCLAATFFLLPLCAGAATGRYMGADMSFANEMEDCGAVYKDGGVAKDPFAILKAHGANIVRVRIWNNA